MRRLYYGWISEFRRSKNADVIIGRMLAERFCSLGKRARTGIDGCRKTGGHAPICGLLAKAGLICTSPVALQSFVSVNKRTGF